MKKAFVNQRAPKQDALVLNSSEDERPFLEPVPYFATPTKRAPSAGVQNSGDEQRFMEPVPYYAATNETTARDIEDRQRRVLELMAEVNRSAAGSAERLAAERALITARSNLRTAARSRASDLEAQLAALKRPGADQSERNRIQSELASVARLLEALDGTEDTAPSKAANADGESWTNAYGETVRMIGGVPRIVK